MFYGCNSLISLPDISKWNIGKDSNIYSMFSSNFNSSINSNKILSLSNDNNYNIDYLEKK